MSKFVFNLADSGKSFGTGFATSVESTLQSRTRNEDLTYSGDDYIVWDRINGERLRRGLPSLTDIGSPRPPPEPEESTVTPSNKPSEVFEVKGPPGLTLEQARAAFDQQAKTGSLVGLKPGSILSAATQAAAGLPSAQAILGQSQSGIIGALGAGIPGAAGAIGAVSSAIKSVAATAVGTLNQTLSSFPVTSPIDVVDYAKQTSALTSIGSMSQSTVTGVLAQTKNLVGQATNVISNDKGLGEFGLDAAQLERAGIVKPGTSTLVQAGSTITEVLKSPAVFTGKDGIKSATDLLSNPSAQASIQQNLMSQGINTLNSAGIPVNSLSAQGLAGVATNAAKSIEGTEALLKKLPIPANVSAEFSDAFNKNIRDGAFAANFSNIKVPPAFKAEIVPVPAEQTVQRLTVNAASTRIVGNDKVPAPVYTAKPIDEDADVNAGAEILRLLDQWSKGADQAQKRIEELKAKVSALEAQQTVTEQQWLTANSELNQLRNEYNAGPLKRLAEAGELYNASSEQVRRALRDRINDASGFARNVLVPAVQDIKQRLAKLNEKIVGTTTT